MISANSTYYPPDGDDIVIVFGTADYAPPGGDDIVIQMSTDPIGKFRPLILDGLGRVAESPVLASDGLNFEQPVYGAIWSQWKLSPGDYVEVVRFGQYEISGRPLELDEGSTFVLNEGADLIINQ